jgi:hypothetical protein
MVWSKTGGIGGSKGGGWSPGIDIRGRNFYGKPRLIVGCSVTDDDDDDDDDNRDDDDDDIFPGNREIRR